MQKSNDNKSMKDNTETREELLEYAKALRDIAEAQLKHCCKIYREDRMYYLRNIVRLNQSYITTGIVNGNFDRDDISMHTIRGVELDRIAQGAYTCHEDPILNQIITQSREALSK